MSEAQYSRLPKEEGEAEVIVQTQESAQSSKIYRTALSWLAVLIATVLVVAAIVGWVAPPSPLEKHNPDGIQKDDMGEEWLRSHAARATGDQYLLGVGKADITG